MLLEMLLDISTLDGAFARSVQGGEIFNAKVSTRAEIFYAAFRDPVDEYLIANWAAVAQHVMTSLTRSNLMLRVLLSVADRHHLFPKLYSSKRFLEPTFKYIRSVETWASPTASQEQRDNMLELLKKLVKVGPAFILGERRDTREMGVFVRDCVVAFLSRESALPLPFKTEVLELLTPILVYSSAGAASKLGVGNFLSPIRTSVRNIIVYNFPTTSTDYSEQSTVYGQYIEALNALFTALSSSCSLLLLEELFSILREPNHRHIVRIDQELATFVHRLTDERAREAFDVCLKGFNDQSLSEELRLGLIRKLCLPIMSKLSTTLLIDAVCSHISPLMRAVKECKIEDTMMQPKITLDKSTVVTRLGVFYILEAAFRLLPDTVIREKVTKQAFLKNDPNSKGTEVTSEIIKAAHFVKSKLKVEYAGEVEPSLALELHCTAYNALASVISCTQKQDKFYTVFCFGENVMKQELLWENIVDLSAHHRFEVETNFAIASRDISALYSKAMQRQLPSTGEGPSNDTALKPRTRFMSSEYLADSSLSQEVSNSAFFAKPERYAYGASSTKDPDAMEVDEPAAPEPILKKRPANDEGIELDPLNSNPCMLSILSLLDDMTTKFGTEWAAAKPRSGPSKMPAWMKAVHEKFVDRNTHLNIRLFIAKIIINKSEVFQPYSDHWFKPLASFVVNDELSGGDPDAARGFHYFLRDLCVCFLKWEYVPPFDVMEEQRISVQFVELLMKRCLHQTRRVMLSNVQLVRLFIQRWQTALMRTGLSKQVPFEYICMDNVKNSKMTKMARIIGMQLLDVLLNNAFDIYDLHLDGAINKTRFFEAILGNLLYVSVDVYRATGTVLGLALNRSRPQPTLRAEIEDLVRVKLNSMFEKDDQVRLFIILDKICAHEPEFVDSFFKKIFNTFRRLRGDAKTLALRLILLRSNAFDKVEMFMFVQPRLVELLRHREGDCQILTIQILKGTGDSRCPSSRRQHS